MFLWAIGHSEILGKLLETYMRSFSDGVSNMDCAGELYLWIGIVPEYSQKQVVRLLLPRLQGQEGTWQGQRALEPLVEVLSTIRPKFESRDIVDIRRNTNLNHDIHSRIQPREQDVWIGVKPKE